jgi:hypothetical protein
MGYGRITSGVYQHQGWYFPCPMFAGVVDHSGTTVILVTSSLFNFVELVRTTGCHPLVVPDFASFDTTRNCMLLILPFMYPG